MEFSRVDTVSCKSLSIASISLRKGGNENEQLGGEKNLCSDRNWVLLQADALSKLILCGSSSLSSPCVVPSSSVQDLSQFIPSYLRSFVHICSLRGPEVMKALSFCV